jgi:large subunit ribosomal protein L14e
MYSIGRICIKLAGRDAGKEAVIVEILDNTFVLIDGNVRRRKCNILHLEPTAKKIEIKEKATHEEIKAEFDKLKLPVWETKTRKTAERPKKQRGKKKKAVEEKPAAKKKAKKTVKTVKETKVTEEKKTEKKETAKTAEKTEPKPFKKTVAKK